MKGLGFGKRVGGFAVKFSHARFYTTIKPLLDSPDPGRLDAAGNWMHFRYSGAITQATMSSLKPTDPDYAPPEINVEFDADGVITLPYCGNVEIVGGLGDYLVNISQAEHPGAGSLEGLNPTAGTGYQPTVRPLRALTSALAPFFQVPDWHTRIWGYNPGVILTEAGSLVTLAPSNVEPGTRTYPGMRYTTAADTVIVTAWVG